MDYMASGQSDRLNEMISNFRTRLLRLLRIVALDTAPLVFAKFTRSIRVIDDVV
jgi:hypothetical protein